MRQTPRRHRNAQGEFIAAAENKVERAAKEFTPNTDDERKTMGPAKNDAFGALDLLTKWRISITPSKAQVCLWAFITATKFLHMLSIATFWVSLIICVKTFPGWDGVSRLFYGIARRRSKGLAWNEFNFEDNFLLDLFPPEERDSAYTLHVSLTDGSRYMPPVLWEFTISPRLENPVFWLIMMNLAFINFYLLLFVHGCLKRAYRAVSRRCSP